MQPFSFILTPSLRYPLKSISNYLNLEQSSSQLKNNKKNKSFNLLQEGLKNTFFCDKL